MQKLIESVPLILLLILTPFFYYNEPNIAQSIIIGAIASLVGYRTYLDSLVKPDYVAIFTERLDAKDLEVNAILKEFHTELNSVKDGQSKLSIIQTKEEKLKNFKW